MVFKQNKKTYTGFKILAGLAGVFLLVKGVNAIAGSNSNSNSLMQGISDIHYQNWEDSWLERLAKWPLDPNQTIQDPTSIYR